MKTISGFNNVVDVFCRGKNVKGSVEEGFTTSCKPAARLGGVALSVNDLQIR